jgi:hypothetical protein
VELPEPGAPPAPPDGDGDDPLAGLPATIGLPDAPGEEDAGELPGLPPLPSLPGLS